MKLTKIIAASFFSMLLLAAIVFAQTPSFTLAWDHDATSHSITDEYHIDRLSNGVWTQSVIIVKKPVGSATLATEVLVSNPLSTAHSYRVRAVNSVGSSLPSNVYFVGAVPDAPTQLRKK